MRDIGKAAAAASGDIQNDLQALREDFGRLAEQVGDILANKGNAAWQRAKSSVDGVVADAQDRAARRSAPCATCPTISSRRSTSRSKSRPYTTLAIVAGLGFLFGATWRR